MAQTLRFEVLARTGALRVTDTFHVVDPLPTEEEGKVDSRFLVYGVRHHAGSDELVKRLKPAPTLVRS